MSSGTFGGGGTYVSTGQQYAGPDLGDRTAPITSPLADGVYWADDVSMTPDGRVVFTVRQDFFGDACVATFGTDPNACLDDRGESDESATVALADTSTVTVAVTVIDPTTITAYHIDPDEFVRLVAGKAPAAGAPPGFAFESGSFLVTVRNGNAVSVDQHYVS
jgi:hypothetical protein